MSHYTPHAAVDIQGRWHDVYLYIYKSLRCDRSFKKWIGSLSNVEYSHEVRERDKEFWASKHADHHVLDLIDSAKSITDTFGLLVAFYVPSTHAFRFAYPHEVELYRAYRTLTPRKSRNGWFPDHEVLRHMQLQINFSYAPRLDMSICESVMRGAFEGDKPIYAGDVYSFKTDLPPSPSDEGVYDVPETAVRFRSRLERAQDVWGMRSVLYVPLRYYAEHIDPGETKDIEGLCLGLYSPTAFALGTYLPSANQPFDVYASPAWTTHATAKIVPRVMYRSLIDMDLAIRQTVRVTISHTITLAEKRIRKTLSEDLTTYAVPVEVLDASLQRARRSAHIDSLSLQEDIRHAIDNNALITRKPEGNIQTLVQCIVNGINEELATAVGGERGRGTQPPRLEIETASSEKYPHVDDDSLCRVIEHVLMEFGRNYKKRAGDHGRGGTVRCGWRDGGSDWYEIEFSNVIPYDESFLKRYWLVREGLLPTEGHDGSDGGMGLFFLRLLPNHFFHIEYSLDVPPGFDSPTDSLWRSRILIQVTGTD